MNRITQFYQAPPPRPWAPAPAARPRTMARTQARRMGQTGGDFVGGIVNLALSGATTYVGLWTGMNQKGVLSIAGWVVGIAGGLSTLMKLGDVASAAAGAVSAPAPATAPAPTPPADEAAPGV